MPAKINSHKPHLAIIGLDKMAHISPPILILLELDIKSSVNVTFYI